MARGAGDCWVWGRVVGRRSLTLVMEVALSPACCSSKFRCEGSFVTCSKFSPNYACVLFEGCALIFIQEASCVVIYGTRFPDVIAQDRGGTSLPEPGSSCFHAAFFEASRPGRYSGSRRGGPAGSLRHGSPLCHGALPRHPLKRRQAAVQEHCHLQQSCSPSSVMLPPRRLIAGV